MNYKAIDPNIIIDNTALPLVFYESSFIKKISSKNEGYLNISPAISISGIIISLKCPLYSDRLFIKGRPSKLKMFIQKKVAHSFKNMQEFTKVGVNSSSLSIPICSNGWYFLENLIIRIV